MSRSLSFSIGLGAAVAFPAAAPPGSILLGEAGPIVNHVALVGADGVPVEVVPPASSFVPSNDNLTDLGDATHRFRTLWLGTSIRNTSSLDVMLDAGTTATFGIFNPTTALGVLLEVDGDVRPLADGLSALGAPLVRWAGIYLSGLINNPSGSLVIACDNAGTTKLTVRNSTVGQRCDIETDGDILPVTTNVRDIGATGARWARVYAGTVDATERVIGAGGLVPFVGTVAQVGAIVGPTPGLVAFATNGRCIGEGPGAGTGTLAWWNGAQWSIADGSALSA